MKAWHFCKGERLRDGQTLTKGKTYEYQGKLELCYSGLHASLKILDALRYAPGNTICRVECSGHILESFDKLVCSKRKVLWYIEGEKILRKFARLCALDVAHLWKPSELVLEYLKTGKESLREDARKESASAFTYAASAATAASSAAAEKMTQEKHETRLRRLIYKERKTK